APLIVELDSKLNMNVLGNVMASGNAHGGNQGWGPTEVNISKLLNAATSANEWQNIFLGNAPSSYTSPTKTTINDRYGNNKLPVGTVPLAFGTPGRWWGPIDFNGQSDPAPAAATAALSLPGSGSALVYQCFPTPPTGYGNGGTNEIQDSTGKNLH